MCIRDSLKYFPLRFTLVFKVNLSVSFLYFGSKSLYIDLELQKLNKIIVKNNKAKFFT